MSGTQPAGHTVSSVRSRRLIPVLALLVACLGSPEAGTEPPVPIRVGETVRATMPAGDARETGVEFLLTAETDGPLTIETHTLWFDTYLRAFQPVAEDEPERIVLDGEEVEVVERIFKDDDGGVAWNSRLRLQAGVGNRIRLAVTAVGDERWGGEFSVTVREGEVGEVAPEIEREQDLAYWDAVEREAARTGRRELSARASLGRGSLFFDERSYAYAATELESAYRVFDQIVGPVHPRTVYARSRLVRALEESNEAERAIAVLRHAVASCRASASSAEVAKVITVLGDFLRSDHRSEEAVHEYREALDIVQSLDDTEPDALVPAITRLAHTLMDLGGREEAAALFDRARQILATRGDAPGTTAVPAPCRVDSATDPAADVMREAIEWELRGRWPEALELYRQTVELRERELGPEHPLVADGLVRYAELLRKDSDYMGIEVKPLLERANAIDPETLACGGRALLLRLQGKTAGAETAAKEALAIVEQSFGVDSLEAAEVLDLLVEMLGLARRWKEALPLARRAIEIKTERFGTLHPDVAWSRFNFAFVANGKRNTNSAMRMWERTLGPDHWLVGAMLNNIALSPDTDAEVAVGYMRRALDITLRHFGPAARDPDRAAFTTMAWLRANLAAVLHRRAIDSEGQGDLEEALQELEESLAAMEQVRSGGDIAMADHHVELAELYVLMGDFASGLRLLERGLELREGAFGADDPRVAVVLIALGGVHREMGNRAEAERCYRRALEIREGRLDPVHTDVGMSLYLLAGVLDSTREREKLELYERAREIWNEAHGPYSAFFVAATDMLAGANWRLGRIEEARALYGQAVRVTDSVSYESYRYALSGLFSNPELHYGQFLVAIGEDSAAETLFEKAIETQERVTGRDHPRLIEELLPLAELLARGGQSGDALRTALRAERIRRDSVRLAARSLAERRALIQASMERSGLDLALSLCEGRGGEPGCAEVFDAVLRSRALVLDEMALRHGVVAERSDDPEIARLADELASAARRLANLTVRGIDPDDPERSLARLERARDAKERAEERLAEKSAAFARELARRRAGLGEVAAGLPADGALIGFVRYRRAAPGSRSDTTHTGNGAFPAAQGETARAAHYAAFLLLPDREPPVFVPLGPAERIEGLVRDWRARVTRVATGGGPSATRAERDYRSAGSSLRRKVWDPLVPHLGDVRRVFVVPDGALHLVSFSALPVGDSEYLAERRPTIHYLSTERDLATIELERRKGRGLLAMGGADFDGAASVPAAAEPPTGPVVAALTTDEDSGIHGAVPVGARPAPVSPAELFRGRRSSCGDFTTMRFEPLPGTAREVERIASLWESHAGSLSRSPAGAGSPAAGRRGEVVRLTRDAAGETAFKRLAPGHRVLHLATHGFFLGSQCESAPEAGRGIGGLAATPDAGSARPSPTALAGRESPLRLSGLVFAGANRRERAGPGEDDGILTAEEIAAVDLSGVEWAVLSACDTGVGDVRAGEGVFGLRRAFRIAGARTLILSLWSVDDESTREWMTALYAARLGARLSTAESVREASLTVLRHRRESGESTHPFYWAAFVAAGDWR